MVRKSTISEKPFYKLLSSPVLKKAFQHLPYIAKVNNILIFTVMSKFFCYFDN